MEENLTMDDLKEELEASLAQPEETAEEIEDPTWATLKGYLDEGTVLTVKISGVVKAGVIANVEGVRGFIPASQLSLSYVENLEDWLNKKIKVQVITVNPESKKLVLSARKILRQEAASERKARLEAVKVGDVMEGKVESLQSYGAFIDLGNGLSGLVHVSQISNKRVKSPDAVLKVGDPVTVKVIALKEGKLSLSIRALMEDSAPEASEERVVIPKSEELTTNLGSLFKDLKF
ncbi:MAG: S1 RNA-binding domain-containing protein [Lachnospiraceae bacterium]|jgi:small subunit ribosomal protein S1|nr:S1 RNA-binding domain-containing protein [Lachnospiraceae bacterium]MCI9133951.1 S1 RNA-binding domain-containing protein [Lachnospiraceae bacterium]